MIKKSKMKKIDKQEHCGEFPKCPVCNSTLDIERKYNPAKVIKGEFIERIVIVRAKCWNCDEYGEYSYDQLNP